MSTYREDAQNDAKDFVADYLKEDIVENLMRDFKTPEILYLYGGYAEEKTQQYSDTEYHPREAVQLLEDLDDFEDSLREQGDWRDVLSSTAAYTYRNAVVHFINELLEEINGIDFDNIIEELLRLLRSKRPRVLKLLREKIRLGSRRTRQTI